MVGFLISGHIWNTVRAKIDKVGTADLTKLEDSLNIFFFVGSYQHLA